MAEMGLTAPTIGTYRGRDIPEWIDAPERGGRHVYVGIAVEDADRSVPLDQLGPDEFVTYPGLIYRRTTALDPTPVATARSPSDRAA